MNDKNKNKRMLKFHFPELSNNETLPLNYRHIMHYTTSEVDEKGKLIEKTVPESYTIKVNGLQCKLSDFDCFYKQISRIFCKK